MQMTRECSRWAHGERWWPLPMTTRECAYGHGCVGGVSCCFFLLLRLPAPNCFFFFLNNPPPPELSPLPPPDALPIWDPPNTLPPPPNPVGSNRGRAKMQRAPPA